MCVKVATIWWVRMPKIGDFTHKFVDQSRDSKYNKGENYHFKPPRELLDEEKNPVPIAIPL